MARAGRSGGGSRGGGGGRSFGGSGGGRNVSGGGSRMGGSGTGFSGTGRTPPPLRTPAPRMVIVGRPRMGGWGWGRGFRIHGPRRGSGFTSIIIAVIALIILLSVISFIANLSIPSGGANQITQSTILREALPRGSASETGELYTDHLNWIGNRTTLNNGLQNFYERTGVRPHLYITGEIDGTANPTNAQGVSFAEQIYNEMFTDQAHLLLVFFENEMGRSEMWFWRGALAETVLDDQAMDILMDYIVRNYHQNNLNEDAFFSRSFDEASQRIMTVHRSPWFPVMIVSGIALILFLLFTWWKQSKAQKNMEAEQTERILSQSLETFGSSGGNDEASRLARQYEENNKRQ